MSLASIVAICFRIIIKNKYEIEYKNLIITYPIQFLGPKEKGVNTKFSEFNLLFFHLEISNLNGS